MPLKEVIPGIVDIKQGINFLNRNQGGDDVGLTIRFEDRSSLENYRPHPSHQEVVRYLKDIGLVDSIIVDFEID